MNDDYYVNIPYPILRSKSMTDKEKLLLGLVQGFVDGEFKMSNETIGKILGTSKRTIQRTMLGLKKKGFVYTRLVIKNSVTQGRIVTLNYTNALIKNLNRD